MSGLGYPWVPTSLGAGSGATREQRSEMGLVVHRGVGEGKAGQTLFPWLCGCALRSPSHRGGNRLHGDGGRSALGGSPPQMGKLRLREAM